jgi:hypothetical protein
VEQAKTGMDRENPEKNFIQKCDEALYGDRPYVSVADKLYLFNGVRHEWQSKGLEQRRICEWLSTYAEEVRPGKFVYKYARVTCIRQVWKWVLMRRAIDPSQLILKD